MNDILTEINSGVMTIVLNRVEKENAITVPMYTAIADALQKAANDAAIRVVVFQGHETIFCAGNDIGDFLNQQPAAERRQDCALVSRAWRERGFESAWHDLEEARRKRTEQCRFGAGRHCNSGCLPQRNQTAHY